MSFAELSARLLAAAHTFAHRNLFVPCAIEDAGDDPIEEDAGYESPWPTLSDDPPPTPHTERASRQTYRRTENAALSKEAWRRLHTANAHSRRWLEAHFSEIEERLPEYSRYLAGTDKRLNTYRQTGKGLGLNGREVHVSRQEHGPNPKTGPGSHADIQNRLFFEDGHRNISRGAKPMTARTQEVLEYGLADEQLSPEEAERAAAEADQACRAATRTSDDGEIAWAQRIVEALRDELPDAEPAWVWTTSPVPRFVRRVLHFYCGHWNRTLAASRWWLEHPGSMNESERDTVKPMTIRLVDLAAGGRSEPSCRAKPGLAWRTYQPEP
jgi:hypothetical protein